MARRLAASLLLVASFAVAAAAQPQPLRASGVATPLPPRWSVVAEAGWDVLVRAPGTLLEVVVTPIAQGCATADAEWVRAGHPVDDHMPFWAHVTWRRMGSPRGKPYRYLLCTELAGRAVELTVRYDGSVLLPVDDLGALLDHMRRAERLGTSAPPHAPTTGTSPAPPTATRDEVSTPPTPSHVDACAAAARSGGDWSACTTMAERMMLAAPPRAMTRRVDAALAAACARFGGEDGNDMADALFCPKDDRYARARAASARCDSGDARGCVELASLVRVVGFYDLSQRRLERACDAKDEQGCIVLAWIRSLTLPTTAEREAPRRVVEGARERCRAGDVEACLALLRIADLAPDDPRAIGTAVAATWSAWVAACGSEGPTCDAATAAAATVVAAREPAPQRAEAPPALLRAACGTGVPVYCTALGTQLMRPPVSDEARVGSIEALAGPCLGGDEDACYALGRWVAWDEDAGVAPSPAAAALGKACRAKVKPACEYRPGVR